MPTKKNYKRKNSTSKKSRKIRKSRKISGGGRASALSMRKMKDTLSDIFGEEQTKPSSVRSQPHRTAKIKSQTERASRAEKKSQKEATKTNVSMLDKLFKSLKV